jgi:hypothetical protein
MAKQIIVNNDQKLVSSEGKKTWNNPEIELIDIQSGANPSGQEGEITWGRKVTSYAVS